MQLVYEEKSISECSVHPIIASSFLVDHIWQKECEESMTGNMLNDFFYFLWLFEGSTRRLDGNQIKRHLISCWVRWKSKILVGKPVESFIFPSSPMNIPPNEKYRVYVNLQKNLDFKFRLFFHFRQRTSHSCGSRSRNKK